MADKALSEANEAVNTATSNQKEKQDAADGAKNGLTQAQKNKDAADKALNDANDGVKTTTATQKEKQTAVDEAQDALTQAQKGKETADKALSEANEAVNTATATQKEKQTAADKAKNEFDGITSQYNAAKNIFKKAQISEKNVEAALNKQKQATQELANAVKAQKQATDNLRKDTIAQQVLATAKTQQQTLDFAVKQKSDKLNNLQTELDQLKQTATALQKKVDDFTNATKALIIANQEAETAAENG